MEAIKGLVNVSDILKKHDAAKHKTATQTQQSSAPLSEGDSITAPVDRKTAVEKVTFGISEADQSIIDSISQVNGKKIASKLCSQGLMNKLRAELKAGRNALVQSGPRYMSVMVDSLISGGFDKRELKALYVANTGMSESAAASHVSFAVPVMMAFGFVQEISGRYVLHPSLRA